MFGSVPGSASVAGVSSAGVLLGGRRGLRVAAVVDRGASSRPSSCAARLFPAVALGLLVAERVLVLLVAGALAEGGRGQREGEREEGDDGAGTRHGREL